jgi:hypothetical protein
MSGTDARFVVFAVAILLLLVGAGVKIYDLKRRRDEDAVAIQARISDALMVEPSLARFPLTPTVGIPLWRRGPMMVEVAGSVPLPELRQAAVDLVLREALRTGGTCNLKDRISVDPALLRRAA